MAIGTCKPMLSFDAALDLLLSEAEPLGTEIVPLGRAGRRRLASDLAAITEAPGFDAAAMDGYAVRSSELEAGYSRFGVGGEILAGQVRLEAIPEREAIAIATGAPMPPGFDQVIPWENVRIGGGVIEITGLPGKRHVRSRGSDFKKGDVLLPGGRVIDPRALVVAAAADITKLTVWRQPRIAVLTNGGELRSPGGLGTIGEVPDSLSEALLLFARQWEGKPSGALRVPDDEDRIRDAVEHLLPDCDILVIAGGASRGVKDLARTSLASSGLRMKFSGVAMKPGKPVWYGRIGEKHVIGLPGNPTAAMTCARLFLAPLICALCGADSAAALRFEQLRLTGGGSPTSDREQFLCASRVGGEALLIEGQSASMQSTLANADILVRIRAGMSDHAEGALADVLRF